MNSFGSDHDSTRRAAERRRDRGTASPSHIDPRLAQVLALQQSAGNAAVSRLLQRQDGGAPAPAPAPAAPAAAAPAAAPAGGGNDALLAMTRVAWNTGVTQRERDAAAALGRPKPGKPDFVQASHQLDEAFAAVKNISAQFATLDPNRVTRSQVHGNAILMAGRAVKPFLQKVTPADVASDIETSVVPSSESAINAIAAPLPATSGQGGTPPTAPAPNPAPAPAPAPIPAGP